MLVKNKKIDLQGASGKERDMIISLINMLCWEEFDLRIDDVPTILEGLGIQEREYNVDVLSVRHNEIRLRVSASTPAEVTISVGNPMNPYPHFGITRDGQKQIYSIRREVKIKKISIAS